MSIGTRVMQIRNQKGVSQRQLSERCGIAGSYLSRIEIDIHKYVDMSVADAKEFMNSEIWKRYETLVKDAAGAARIVDASKISMAVCDVCHLATRRFAVSRINGNIICAGCAATGQK